MSDVLVHTAPAMGTVVSVQIVAAAPRAEREAAAARAAGWFAAVEAACSRFDATSELRRLCSVVGEPVVVSDILFEAVSFAVAVAGETDGAFDPTVGRAMEALGFDRNYLTGERVSPSAGDGSAPSYRDVRVDADDRTVTLARPLVLDLGAVAKGLAIDLAARELEAFDDYAIDAGGDIYCRGRNAAGNRWSVGIRHPRREGEVIEVIEVSGAAVCTSGDYERRASAGGHHLLDTRTGVPATRIASATVFAPTALAADALATAAFVLGPEAGVAFLARQGVKGVLFTSSLERFATPVLEHSRPPQ